VHAEVGPPAQYEPAKHGVNVVPPTQNIPGAPVAHVGCIGATAMPRYCWLPKRVMLKATAAPPVDGILKSCVCVE